MHTFGDVETFRHVGPGVISITSLTFTIVHVIVLSAIYF